MSGKTSEGVPFRFSKATWSSKHSEQTILCACDIVEERCFTTSLIGATSYSSYLEVRADFLVNFCQVSILTQSVDEGSEVEVRSLIGETVIFVGRERHDVCLIIEYVFASDEETIIYIYI
jgi:hypothetical protein